MADDDPRDVRQISLRLSAELVQHIDALKAELGCRSRGAVVERLLHNLLGPEGEEAELDAAGSHRPRQLEIGSAGPAAPAVAAPAPREQAQVSGAFLAGTAQPGDDVTQAASPGQESQEPAPQEPRSTQPEPQEGDFDECGALVLLAGNRPGELVVDPLPEASRRGRADPGAGVGEQPSGPGARRTQRGIDLPGFVQRRSDQLRRSLDPRTRDHHSGLEPMPQVSADRLTQALAKADQHWLELYDQPAQAPVLEAAMLWIAQDIWPQSDQSEGRLFTWSLGSAVMRLVAPSWPEGPASFAKVMVMAGVLEDPFSSATLELRIPTLIRRFVHRFRQRRSGTSFQSLEHTMTLLGALKLLELPTDPGERLTLPQIREAYREMALAHHPDAGGSEDLMRRLNEAYQLLKELYRNR